MPGYDWNWSLLLEFLCRRDARGEFEPGLLLQGLAITLKVGCWTFLAAIVLGIIVGVMAHGKLRLLTWPCRIYINLARNTPPIVLLFCVYFFVGNVPLMGQAAEILRHAPLWLTNCLSFIFADVDQLDRMVAAVLALGLYQGAFFSEIIREGVNSVGQGQWDAAYGLGFSRLAALRFFILPQTGRLLIPPMTSQMITTFKETALVSLISLPDLTFQSLEIMTITSMTFEVWIVAGCIYLILGGICSILGRWLEKKYSFQA